MNKAALFCVFLLVCVAAESYSHMIVLKPSESSEIDVTCGKGDVINVGVRSVGRNYFYIEILNPRGNRVFSKGSSDSVSKRYEVPDSGVYKVRITNKAEASETVVEYTITRTYRVERTDNLKLPGSIS
jgi:hypothetical protein